MTELTLTFHFLITVFVQRPDLAFCSYVYNQMRTRRKYSLPLSRTKLILTGLEVVSMKNDLLFYVEGMQLL